MRLEFAAHEDCPVGMLGLELIEKKKKRNMLHIKTTKITGNDPCPPSGSYLFIQGPPGNYPNPYAYLQSLSTHAMKPDAVANLDEFMQDRLCWIQSHMRWVLLADWLIFVNPRHLGADGIFHDEHRTQYEAFVEGLCGVPAAFAP